MYISQILLVKILITERKNYNCSRKMAHIVTEILDYPFLKRIKYMHIHTCIFYTVLVYDIE
jgi:hypothetical protein